MKKAFGALLCLLLVSGCGGGNAEKEMGGGEAFVYPELDTFDQEMNRAFSERWKAPRKRGAFFVPLSITHQPAVNNRSFLRSRRQPLQPFLSIELHERSDQFVQIPLDDLIELVQRQADAMVGEAALGKVVRADPFAAVA
jgi:hypothetical protein